jgi:ectoine hydroxylase-related dioxygenase (phytanoyl-CoA dioxygenase family)
MKLAMAHRSPRRSQNELPHKSSKSDRLPIEFFDFESRLSSHANFNQFLPECEFLHQNGYVILPSAVNTDLCDQLAKYYSDVLDFSTNNIPFCDYFTSEGKRIYGEKYSPNVGDKSDRRFKMLDLHGVNKTALQICLAPITESFLSLIFNSDVLAFQQLGFVYGTEQPIHQDTAYVRVSKPAMIAASWVALEDIEEGSGELEFIPGSHKYDNYRFDSSEDKWCNIIEQNPQKSIWWNNKDDASHDKLLDSLEKLIPSFGSGKFRASKGDVLIWISFFAHGGSKISDAHFQSLKTRKSLVTHYCPWPSVHPMYFYKRTHVEPIKYGTNSWFTYKIYPEQVLPEDFNPDRYLELHPDILSNEKFAKDPGLHFAMHGKREGRAYL